MMTVSKLEGYDHGPYATVAQDFYTLALDDETRAVDLRHMADAIRGSWKESASQDAAQACVDEADLLEGNVSLLNRGADILQETNSRMGTQQNNLMTARSAIEAAQMTLLDDGTVTVPASLMLVARSGSLVGMLAGGFPGALAGSAAAAALIHKARMLTYQVRVILTAADTVDEADAAALAALAAEQIPTPQRGPIDLDDESIRLTADINQQDGYGDCATLALLTGISEVDPQWVRDHMRWDPDKQCYLVTVYDPETGQPREVEVDPATLPTSGAQAYGGSPTWLAVMEEAYASEFGPEFTDYGKTFDEAAAYVLGTRGESHPASFDDIRATIEGEPPGAVVVGTTGFDQPRYTDPSRRLVDGHAYVVTGFDDAGNIVLQNPWGPNGGYAQDGTYCPGEVHLTETEFKMWFGDSYHVPAQP